jgi:RNA polymerase sigma factor (sigma-70 family)
MQAYLSLDSLRRVERFGPWLAGIALNICRIWLRNARGGDWSLDSLLGGRLVTDPIDPEPGPLSRAEASDLAERLRRVVAHLPTGQRSAVLLFYLAGLSHVEVAATLGVPVGAVKTRLHKARQTLRQLLSAEFEENQMQTTEQLLIQMRVYDVLRQPDLEGQPLPQQRWVMRLEEVDGERRLDIGIGRFEGESLSLLLGSVPVLRPLTYTFMANLLRAAGARLHEARIDRLEGITYYAEAVIETPTGTQVVDARPSDAITLAVVQGAPIYVAAGVFQARLGVPPFTIDANAVGLDVLVAEARQNVERQRQRRQAASP